MYLGASTTHSSTVGHILNLKTSHISPQYHVIYDELFTSVQGELIDQVFDARHWQELIEFGGEERLLDPTDAADDHVPLMNFMTTLYPTLTRAMMTRLSPPRLWFLREKMMKMTIFPSR
jgi:hypothetical protein